MVRNDAGQTHVFTAIVLPAAVSLFALLVVNLVVLAGDMIVLQNDLSLAVHDGAGLLTTRADDTVFYHLADSDKVKAMAHTVATENLAAHGYDPALLDGATVPNCETSSGPCIYVAQEAACGVSDPLDLSAATRCGPFVSIRATIPVDMPLGGTVTHTFHAAAGARVTASGEERATPMPATPEDPVEGPVGW